MSYIIKQLKFYVLPTAAVILSGTFFFSAVSKLFYWSATAFAIESLTFSKMLASIISTVIIILELLLSLSLIQPKHWKLSGSISVFILIIFTGVVFWGKTLGLITQCPCFGKLFGANIGTGLIIRNSVLLLCGVILYIQKPFLHDKSVQSERFYFTLKNANYLLVAINALFIGKIVGILFS